MNDIIAQAPYGTLAGRQSERGAEFLGIRYAEPPTGARRFLPPFPRRRSAVDVVDARTAGPAPAQPIRPIPNWFHFEPPPTDEDCLSLSVHTPRVDAERRPVLVNVFGGGFETGSATGGFEDPLALATRTNCVVVRVNFRVGALGFLHLGEIWGEPYRAGNVGLLDLCAALEWVHDNIVSLGGDPTNVTVFGLSSGAFMIAALFGAPAASGLFHRAWMQSGSASRVIERDIAAGQAAEFLDALGVTVGDAAALASVGIDRVLQAQERIVSRDLGERNAPRGRALGIVDDGHTLKQHPMDVFCGGSRRDVPIMLGTTRDEARLFFAMGAMREVTSEAALRHEIARFVGHARAPHLLDAYRGLMPEADLVHLRERFLTDAVYRVPAIRTATAHAGNGGSAHVYQFAWQSTIAPQLGASHAMDQSFVWGVSNPAEVGYLSGSTEEQCLAEEMSSALGRFATSGDPGWPSYSAEQRNTRVFGESQPHVLDVDSPIVSAWEGIERR